MLLEGHIFALRDKIAYFRWKEAQKCAMRKARGVGKGARVAKLILHIYHTDITDIVKKCQEWMKHENNSY